MDDALSVVFVTTGATTSPIVSVLELTATLQAHQSNVEATLAGSSGAMLTESWHDHNFIINAAELILNGALTLPLEGDELLETKDDGSHTVYELMAPDQGQRVYEPIDAEARKLFIFCKETKTEPAA